MDSDILYVLNTSDPSSPQIHGTWSMSRTAAGGIAVSGGVAYVACGGALNLIDVSNSDPVPLRTSVGLDAIAVAALGSLAIVVGPESLHVVDTATEPQQILSAISVPGIPPWLPRRDVSAVPGIALVAAGSSGLQVVDVSDPTAPIIVGQAELPASIVAASGTKAAVANQQDLHIVDFADPRAPLVRTSFTLPDVILDLDLEGDRLFVATKGLMIIDVSDPSHLSILGSSDTSDWVHAVDVVGDRAYVGNTERFRILDVSVPSAPSLMGSMELEEFIWDIAIRGGFAYLGSEYAGMIMANVSNPSAPHLIGGVDTPGYVRSLDIGLNGVYIADSFNYGGPLHVAPVQCAAPTLSFDSMSLDSGAGRLPTKMTFGSESRAHLVSAYPVPFGNKTTLAFALDRAINVRLTIHDVTGRLVRDLLNVQLSRGRHEHEWNGRDSQGDEVSPGMYFVRLQAGEQVAVEKVTRSR